MFFLRGPKFLQSLTMATPLGKLRAKLRVRLKVTNYILLGSKELGTNVLELHFVMLVNHDQNILVLF